jgi:hypothetical protein
MVGGPVKRFPLTTLVCLFLQVISPCQAASIPWAPESPNIGILGLGIGEADEQGRAYHYLEKSLRKWLEGNRTLSLAVTAELESSFDAERSRDELLRNQLGELARRLVQLGSGEFTSNAETEAAGLSETIDKVWQEHGQDTTLGPQWQAVLVADALFQWRALHREKAEERLRQAVQLSPDGSLKSAIGWDLEGAGGLAGFFDAVDRAQSRLSRSCRVQLEVTPAEAHVTWNGFELENTHVVNATPGNPFRVVAEGPHLRTQIVDFVCGKSGRQRLVFHLTERRAQLPDDPLPLLKISESHRLRSLVVVDTKGDRFHLYLYSPQSSLDEIPLTQPLTFHDVLSRGADADLPIAADAFSALLQKHRLAPVRLAMNGNPQSLASGLQPDLNIRDRVLESPPERRWYNSPIFWTIVGAVALGGVAAYFTLGSHSDNVQRGIPVKVE